MSLNRSTFFKFAAAAAVAAGALFAGSAANAGVSVGINLPGLAIGVAPGYYAPSPVYSAPAPVYYNAPQPYYAPAPVYYRPAPVYYNAPPVYYRPAPGYYRNHGHGYYRGY
jgi:hypothetical protein